MTIQQVKAERRGLAVQQVLESSTEDRFSRFTRLAQTAFQVPYSTLTLIDHDRAYFKSCVGIELAESPSNITFCSRTVARDAPVVVEDASLDPVFRDFPGVTGEVGVRFYAGFPLHDSQGTALGAFCIFGDQPRTFSDHEHELMAELASWVETELQSSGEMERARAVQRALLPRTPPTVAGYETAAMCVAAGVVAGDFFDHQQLGSQHAFTVADVMGKGTGAAILMATTRAVVRSEYRAFGAGRFGEDATMGNVLTEVNAILMDDLAASSAFVTGFFGWGDSRTGRIRYVDAGHGLTLILRADGTHEHLASTDLPLGVTDAWRWTEARITLEAGDMFLCFSDGLFDLLGGTPAALDVIAGMARAYPRPADLMKAIQALAGDSIAMDDVTVLAIRRSVTS